MYLFKCVVKIFLYNVRRKEKKRESTMFYSQQDQFSKNKSSVPESNWR